MNRLAGLPQFMKSRWEVERHHGVALADCPFCGGAPYLYASPSPHVVCGACAATGPAFEARKEKREEAAHKAILAWNLRS